MKTVILKTIIITCIAVLAGCDHGSTVNMYTHINPDGSCYREFSKGVDSAFFAGDTSKNPFPMKLDSSWKRIKDTSWYKINERIKDTSLYKLNGKEVKEDSILVYHITLRKNYPSVKDLESFRFNNNSNWDSVAPKIKFRKNFKWFYTFYEFSETYPKVNPFHTVSTEKYITNEELEALYGENTTLFKGKNGLEVRDMLNSLEDKANSWLRRSYYEEIFRITLKYYKYFKNSQVDSATFALAKDSIYLLDEDHSDIDKMDFDKLFDKYFKTNAFTKPKKSKEFDEAIKKEIPDFARFFGTNLNYILNMPGKIIETNTPIVNGDTLSWKVDAYRFFFNGYTLSAKSRKPNVWAFWVTGAIVLLVMVSFWVKRK